jgi:hypothetical protein
LKHHYPSPWAHTSASQTPSSTFSQPTAKNSHKTQRRKKGREDPCAAGGGGRGGGQGYPFIGEGAARGRTQGSHGRRKLCVLVGMGGCQALQFFLWTKQRTHSGRSFSSFSPWNRIKVTARNIFLDVYSTNLVQDLR